VRPYGSRWQYVPTNSSQVQQQRQAEFLGTHSTVATMGLFAPRITRSTEAPFLQDVANKLQHAV